MVGDAMGMADDKGEKGKGELCHRLEALACRLVCASGYGDDTRWAPRRVLIHGDSTDITHLHPQQIFSTFHLTKLFHHSSSRTKLFTTPQKL